MASGLPRYGRKVGLSFVVAILVAVVACSDFEAWQPDTIVFVIKQGKHTSNHKMQTLMTNRIAFDALFDESAIYTSIDPIQQHSKNKLMGFADCNSSHQDNSARFGWHWIDSGLHVTAYVYQEGERVEDYIGEVNLNQFHSYEISFDDSSYYFKLDDLDAVIIPRKKSCNVGIYYVLWPYFGGQETAPHDIKILIKLRY